jgi:mRNA interferase HigB
MKVHLIKKQSIEDYVQENARSKPSFAIWLSVLKRVDWENPEDILETFGSADLLGNGSGRVVFDIGGNKYRTICKYLFGQKQAHLFICWIGTHADYDAICKKGKQYSISNY